MPTPKESFLRLMRNDRPDWVGDPWSCFVQGTVFRPIVMDAVTRTLGSPRPGQTGFVNKWGVTMDWVEGQPGATPHVTESNKLIKDITHWQEYVTFPSLENLKWEKTDALLPPVVDRENYLLMAGSFTGMFEFSCNTMGFTDALMNYLIEPEAMFELLSAYTDWKIKAVGLVIDHLQPDIIHSHDDWGDKRSLFLSPTVWREIIKPQYERFYGYIKSRGVLVQHHCDSVAQEICEDMVDIGIDMWQGAIPQNDIPGVIERTGGKLCVMGGLDMQKIDFADALEEDIRAEVRHCIDTYMPLGSFMPCVPCIIPIHKNVERILNDELDTYGAEYAAKYF